MSNQTQQQIDTLIQFIHDAEDPGVVTNLIVAAVLAFLADKLKETATSSDLNAAVTALEAVDASLNQAIQDEATARQSADSVETNARIDADTALSGRITSLQNALNTLMNGDVTDAIETFNEVILFLDGVTDDKTLTGLLTAINNRLNGVDDDMSNKANLDQYTRKLSYEDAPVVVLESMGRTLDNINNDGIPISYHPGAGNTYWDSESGLITYVTVGGEPKEQGPPKSGLIYCNKYTNLTYRWRGSQLGWQQVGGSGGNSSDASLPVEVENTNTGDLEIADEYGNVILRLSEGLIRTKNFDPTSSSGGGGDSGGGGVSHQDLSIFFIGNSFTMDAISYVPWILKEIAPEVNLKLGCAYYSMCTLADHKTKMQNDSADYTYYRYPDFNGNLTWGERTGQKMSDMLTPEEDWDIVSLQEYSGRVGNFSYMQSSLQDCMDLAAQRLGKTPEYWWLMGQRSLTATYVYSVTFSQIVSVCQQIMANYDISELIPVGTAIENARRTSLNDVGGDNITNTERYPHPGLTADGAHLQEGLPVLIAGYALATTILERLGIDKSVLYNPYVVTSANNPTPNNSNCRHGSVTGMTSENMLIGQICSIMANKFKYQVQTI